MEIPLNAQVECSDGDCGHIAGVLINPISDQVIHLIVKVNANPDTEYIVPVDKMGETIAGTIQLRCSRAELEKMECFIKTEFIEENVPYRDYGFGGDAYGLGSYYYAPYVIPDRTVYVPVKHLQVPPGELAVRRGARVEALDGHVGNVDEFVINPENDHISHLVMREGHLWGQKDVIIPVSSVKEVNDKTVFLNLHKHEIESLPTFPIHRRWA